MVSQALVQSKLFYGLGKAAAALGASCNWYRGTSATTNPILPGTLLGTIQAAFQVPGNAYTSPSRYAKPEWWGLFDGTNVEVGDYIVEPTLGTFFVASLEPVHYPMCVRCNRVASFARPNPNPPSTPAYSHVPGRIARGAGRGLLWRRCAVAGDAARHVMADQPAAGHQGREGHHKPAGRRSHAMGGVPRPGIPRRCRARGGGPHA